VSWFGGRNKEGETGNEPLDAPHERSKTSALSVPPMASSEVQKSEAIATERVRPPVKRGEVKMAHIGKSISIKGDLTGNEDLVIEGQVEGKIELPNNELTIGAEGRVSADVHAKCVIVVGRVSGNVSAGDRVEVQGDGFVNGDVKAPRLIVQEGAVVNGNIEMTKREAPRQAAAPSAKAGSTPPLSAAREPIAEARRIG